MAIFSLLAKFYLNIHSGIFDLRQRQLMQTFIAHDSDVKSIAVDESEEFFVTGSLDGDIKVGNVCLHFKCTVRFEPTAVSIYQDGC